MRLDSDIKRDVEDQLRSDPDIDATEIAVAVKDGVVTLTGYVRSFRQRRKAEQDVKRVAGVLGVANDIEVRLPIIHRRPDPEIARDAVEAIKRELPYSWEAIKVTVDHGLIMLEGEVEWHYQHERAEEAVQSTRRHGRHQLDQHPAACCAGRDQAQDREGVAASGRDRR